MNVTQINHPGQNVGARLRAKRCQRTVRDPRPGYLHPYGRHCERFAVFNIDGIRYCTQHAGEACLKEQLRKTQ